MALASFNGNISNCARSNNLGSSKRNQYIQQLLSSAPGVHFPRHMRREGKTCSLISEPLQSAFDAGAPNLQGLMLDDLRWSSCNNDRNKVHNKCNTLESSPNHNHHHLPTLVRGGKKFFFFFTKPVPGAKKVGGRCFNRLLVSLALGVQFTSASHSASPSGNPAVLV